MHAGSPHSPTLSITGNEICFISDTHSTFPVEYYTIEIVDLPGDVQTFNDSVSAQNQKSCVRLSKDRYPAECSPYNISVHAYNFNGYSPASSITYTGINRILL